MVVRQPIADGLSDLECHRILSGSRGMAIADYLSNSRLLARYVSSQRPTLKKRRLLAPLDEERFEAFPDPLNTWVVWDNKEEFFAEFGSRYLRFLTEAEAKEFCTLLNMLLSDPGW